MHRQWKLSCVRLEIRSRRPSLGGQSHRNSVALTRVSMCRTPIGSWQAPAERERVGSNALHVGFTPTHSNSDRRVSRVSCRSSSSSGSPPRPTNERNGRFHLFSRLFGTLRSKREMCQPLTPRASVVSVEAPSLLRLPASPILLPIIEVDCGSCAIQTPTSDHQQYTCVPTSLPHPHKENGFGDGCAANGEGEKVCRNGSGCSIDKDEFQLTDLNNIAEATPDCVSLPQPEQLSSTTSGITSTSNASTS